MGTVTHIRQYGDWLPTGSGGAVGYCGFCNNIALTLPKLPPKERSYCRKCRGCGADTTWLVKPKDPCEMKGETP